MNTESKPKFRHSELNEGKGVWIQETAIALLWFGRHPKTAEELSHDFGKASIGNPESDLFLKYGTFPGDNLVNFSSSDSTESIARLQAQKAAWKELWGSFEKVLLSETLDGTDASNQKPIVSNQQEVLARILHGDPPIIRFSFFGFNPPDINDQSSAERYRRIRRIIELIRRHSENKKVQVLFHDFLYEAVDQPKLYSSFRCGERNPVEVSVRNDGEGLTKSLYDDSTVIFTHSSSTPYRQMIAEHVVHAIESGKPHPRAVVCFPADSNDDDTRFRQHKRNHTSDLVNKWLGHYTDKPLRLTEEGDEVMGNLVLHTIGRVPNAEPSLQQD